MIHVYVNIHMHDTFIHIYTQIHDQFMYIHTQINDSFVDLVAAGAFGMYVRTHTNKWLFCWSCCCRSLWKGTQKRTYERKPPCAGSLKLRHSITSMASTLSLSPMSSKALQSLGTRLYPMASRASTLSIRWAVWKLVAMAQHRQGKRTTKGL